MSDRYQSRFNKGFTSLSTSCCHPIPWSREPRKLTWSTCTTYAVHKGAQHLRLGPRAALRGVCEPPEEAAGGNTSLSKQVSETWSYPRICWALTSPHSFLSRCLTWVVINGWVFQQATHTCLYCFVRLELQKQQKIQLQKQLLSTANRSLPLKELLHWKRHKVEKIPTNASCHLACVQVHASQGQGGSGKTYFRHWLQQIQVFKRGGPIVTEEISNQEGKFMCWGRSLCREGACGGWEHESQVEHSEMVESVLLDAHSRATAVLPEMQLWKCSVTETH